MKVALKKSQMQSQSKSVCRTDGHNAAYGGHAKFDIQLKTVIRVDITLNGDSGLKYGN